MSAFRTSNPDDDNYVEFVIYQFIQKSKLKLEFVGYDFSSKKAFKKATDMDVLIKFLESSEFKTYNFEVLNLRNNSISLEYLSLILKYLNENPFITTLNLSRNYLEMSEFKLKLYPLIRHYFSVNTTLKVLDLSKTTILTIKCWDNEDNYDYDYDYPFMFIIEIMNAIKSNPNSSIEELNLSDNDINEEGLLAISKMLETNKSLKKLNLSHSKFNGSLKILGKSLLLNETLLSLNIYNIFESNTFSSKELINFGSIIENNFTLQEIDYFKSIYENDFIDIILERNIKLVKSKEKFMNFMLTIRKQNIKKRIFPVELYDLIFSEFILTF